jgi:hypothetical protein
MNTNGAWSVTPIIHSSSRDDRCKGGAAVVSARFLYAYATCEDVTISDLDGNQIIADKLSPREYVATFVSRESDVAAEVLKRKSDPFDTGNDLKPVKINVYDLRSDCKVCSISTPKPVNVLGVRSLYSISGSGYVAFIQDAVLSVVQTRH